MSSRRENPVKDQKAHLAHLRLKHQPQYADNEAWGCICEYGVECLYLVLVQELNKTERDVIRLLKELKDMGEQYQREVREYERQIEKLKRKNRELREENDALQQERDSSLP